MSRDRLNGNAGNDQLTGGGSIDSFIFNTKILIMRLHQKI
ncbi:MULTISPECIES: hypothetical protein [Okeania]|nr:MULTISPECIES: hypothetical protein [Okeania]NET15331.1 hypothetical protein [Okeania sp. SIO1H6]NET76280.1 hypothetical protein [Okeania sp. SIO1F9]NET94000.1 hypothetical protein [Okeania sp. SIO1H2]NES77268.1 hypothetical protein [Okeania sp. SIO1H4]NES88196.1 hypothetical protein [Okeania sp. SIO2B9]